MVRYRVFAFRSAVFAGVACVVVAQAGAAIVYMSGSGTGGYWNFEAANEVSANGLQLTSGGLLSNVTATFYAYKAVTADATLHVYNFTSSGSGPTVPTAADQILSLNLGTVSLTGGGWQSLSFDIASPVNVPDHIWLGFSFNNSSLSSPSSSGYSDWGVGMAESPVIGHSDGLFEEGQPLYPWGNFSLSVAAVPEPFTLALCAGALGLALARRRKSA